MTASQDWFPGLDFPDREEWLKYRAKRAGKPVVLSWSHTKQPLVLGLNKLKRAAKKLGGAAGRAQRQEIVRQRHAFAQRGNR